MNRSLMHACGIAIVLVLSRGAAVPAQPAGPASGFALEAVLGVAGESFIGIGGPTFLDPRLAPAIRIGGMWRAFTVTASLSYTSISSPEGDYTGFHILALGPNVEATVWDTPDGTARMYLLAGFDLGAAFEQGAYSPGEDENDETFLGGFSLGVGGRYFLHRNFGLGLEIGSHTRFFEADDPTAFSTLYAALTAAFVAGD